MKVNNTDMAEAYNDKVNGSEEEEFEYIFGFGSIMNTTTHAPWLKTSSSPSSSSSSSSSTPSSLSSSDVLLGVVATLSKDFGYARQWNFRSDTGFTALGVTKAASGGTSSSIQASDINGVLFRIAQSMIPGFDRREVGYKKVAVPIQYLHLIEPPGNGDGDSGVDRRNGDKDATSEDKAKGRKFGLSPTDRVWLYVPLPSHCKPADENHPLLQSYVDTVLQGCLEWGGEVMAETFLQTTGGWSTYFLNDTPSSRRPWLYRKDYATIDRLLQKYSIKTHFGDRKHPEEFSSAFHRRMKGTWSLPRRNNNFTGREFELQNLRGRFHQSSSSSSSSSSQAIVKVEVAGMGGVGKTQLVTEYCYRFFPSEYGLVVWLNAESAEALVADYRQLLMDLAQEDASEVVTVVAAELLSHRREKGNSAGTNHESSGRAGDNSTVASPSGDRAGSKNATSTTATQDTDEIVREVKTRLFRSQVPWLLVFDNLEDRSLLNAFVPRGAGTRGHILVTTRLVDMESGVDDDASGTLLLGCFSPNESMELLRRAAGSRNMEGEANIAAAKQICERLGHLPLALGMAAAYMHRCDVDSVDYLGRYTLSEKTGQSLLRHGKLLDYSHSVASSLSLSLAAIEKESSAAYGILRVLCFLGPDQITKPLLRHLLSSEQRIRLIDLDKRRGNELVKRLGYVIGGSVVLSCTVGFTTSMVTRNQHNMTRTAALAAFAAITAAATSAAAFNKGRLSLVLNWKENKTKKKHRGTPSFNFSADLYEQGDIVWDILKSYSLLTVKDGKGSMHRLLAQALRISQGDSEWQYNLRICLDTMESMWTFKADETDTWKGSLNVLEHVKSVVCHSQSCSFGSNELLRAGRLSTEAGVFSAMALNAFIEAQQSFELSIAILAGANITNKPNFQKARAEALHELGRVFRYQGKYIESRQSLMDALAVYEKWAARDIEAREGVADTLHELGVLEVKKHNLDTATEFLQQSLDMRRGMNDEYTERTDANSAATLHQLAAICVAKKPPSLAKAESLLQEALGLSRQIGQRAATLKQLARVTIRQGRLDRAESYLEQALDLYIELYGDNKNHINIAGVKFQQGALALQREQWEQAWQHFSECLRIRKFVYAYARPVCSDEDDPYPTHLEVSCVLHELARVALAQGNYRRAMETLKSERIILQRLEETSEHRTERIHQARLTNLTWLRKCAKEMGDEDIATGYSSERSDLKKAAAARMQEEQEKTYSACHSLTLSEASVVCRLAARKYALEKDKDGSKREDLDYCISKLSEEIKVSPSGPVKAAAERFIGVVLEWRDQPVAARRGPILTACDFLRDVLRANGVQVNDMISKGPEPKRTRQK